MAVMHNFDQTKTFSAPNGYNLLPDNVKRNFDAKNLKRKLSIIHIRQMLLVCMI